MKIVRCFSFVLVIVLVFSSSVQAQRDETVGVRAQTDTVVGPQKNPGVARAFMSVAGVTAGTFAGALVGYRILPHDCGCDDPGLDALIYGAFGGMVIGAALGASGPNLGSGCSFHKRFGRSLGGAALTAVAAYYVAGGRGNEGTLLAVPIGAVGGSLAGLGSCWRART